MNTHRWTKRDQDRIIIEYIGEVEKQAVKFYYRLNGNIPVNQDDAIATAYLALVKSARCFDPLNGGRFCNYACKSVKHALIDMVKDCEVAPGCMILPLHDG